MGLQTSWACLLQAEGPKLGFGFGLGSYLSHVSQFGAQDDETVAL